MEKTDSRLIGEIALLIVGIFVLDLWMPLGVAGGVPYVAVVLLSLRSPRRQYTLNVATVSTALTILGFFFSSPPLGSPLWMILTNRFLALFAIWVTTILCLERKRVEEMLNERDRWQEALAELRREALAINDLSTLMDIIVHLVARNLEVEYCSILELLPDRNALLLRSGVGWKEGLVGKVTVDADANSQAGYTLLSNKPVVMEDLRTETRFLEPALLRDHGVVSGVSVVIKCRDSAFGVLSGHSSERRKFSENDIYFLDAIASLLADAIMRNRSEQKLRRSEELYRTVLRDISDAVFLTYFDGTFAYICPNVSVIFGLSVDEAQAMGNIGKLLGDNLFDRSELTASGEIQNIDRVITDKLGKDHLLLVNVKHVSIQEGTVLYTCRDVTERRSLEKAVLEATGREQRRIGQDLHDGLGQHLAGVLFMSKVLQDQLSARSAAEAAEGAQILQLIRQAIDQVRMLARGLNPVNLKEQGLLSSLKELAGGVENLFGIACIVEGDEDIVIQDDTIATHLYRIAQEAVNNAIKHGKAKNVFINLAAAHGNVTLTVEDNGSGFPEELGKRKGMGLKIMGYRANMIRGFLQLQPAPDGGSIVRCTIPDNSLM